MHTCLSQTLIIHWKKKAIFSASNSRIEILSHLQFTLVSSTYVNPFLIHRAKLKKTQISFKHSKIYSNKLHHNSIYIFIQLLLKIYQTKQNLQIFLNNNNKFYSYHHITSYDKKTNTINRTRIIFKARLQRTHVILTETF